MFRELWWHSFQCSPWLVQSCCHHPPEIVLNVCGSCLLFFFFFFANVLSLPLCSAGGGGVPVSCRLCRVFKVKQGLDENLCPTVSTVRRVEGRRLLLWWLLPGVLACGHGRLCVGALCSLPVHLSQPPFAPRPFSFPGWIKSH